MNFSFDKNKIAIIPARGGSKRLPRKNIISINGKPAIYYTISAAISSKMFDRIIVSTEDEEISRISKNFGAEVWKRDKKLSTDNSTMDEVMLDVLENYKLKFNCLPNYFCCLLATSILRKVDDIRNTYLLLKKNECDFAITYKEYESSPHEALEIKEEFLKPKWPDIMFAKRWKRPKLVKDAGSVYWLNTKSFIEQKTFFGENLKGYLIPRNRAVDIDDQFDLELIEYYLKQLNENE